MFFNSYNFKLLEAGTNLTWTKQELHMQNIANVETPGYKAKQLEFINVLSEEKLRELLNKSGFKIEYVSYVDETVIVIIASKN